MLTLDNSFEEILDPNHWSSGDSTIPRSQALIMTKLAKTIEGADRTATAFNRRILWLTVVMAVFAAVQCWPIIAGWFK